MSCCFLYFPVLFLFNQIFFQYFISWAEGFKLQARIWVFPVSLDFKLDLFLYYYYYFDVKEPTFSFWRRKLEITFTKKEWNSLYSCNFQTWFCWLFVSLMWTFHSTKVNSVHVCVDAFFFNPTSDPSPVLTKLRQHFSHRRLQPGPLFQLPGTM